MLPELDVRRHYADPPVLVQEGLEEGAPCAFYRKYNGHCSRTYMGTYTSSDKAYVSYVNDEAKTNVCLCIFHLFFSFFLVCNVSSCFPGNMRNTASAFFLPIDLRSAARSCRKLRYNKKEQRVLHESFHPIPHPPPDPDGFQSVSTVKTLFEDWKRRHGEQYAQAYCTLTLPDLLAPFVRLEVSTRIISRCTKPWCVSDRSLDGEVDRWTDRSSLMPFARRHDTCERIVRALKPQSHYCCLSKKRETKELSLTAPPPCPRLRRAPSQLVRWDPLTGQVQGVDDVNDTSTSTSSSVMAVDNDPNRSAEGQAPPGAGTGARAGAGAGGDETDEGEDDLDGVLERFEWYRRLFDFSGDIPPPESASYGPDEDPDQNLVPQVRYASDV